MLEITTKIDLTVKKYNMLSEGDFVVAGVSGGADSMLMLHYFLSKKDELSLRLLVANVEHGIRGEESINDSKFVEDFCNENGIEFKCLKINAPLEAEKNGISVEEYSRNARYEFFNSFGADKIATAHNQSDNVETLLFRLSRGTALKGCCGIPPVRDNIIRPLIEISSQDVRNACKKYGVDYVEDSTNAQNDYSRNYIRNVVIDNLKSVNTAFEENASRFIITANEDESCLSELALDAYNKCIDDNGLNIKKLCEYHKAIIKRVIIIYAKEFYLSLDEIHLNKIYDLTQYSGKQQIKGDFFAISNKNYLRIARLDKTTDISFLVDKKVIDYNSFLTNCKLLKKEFAFYCDYDKIVHNISVRSRIEGDTISPENRGITKSLKKLFNEYQIRIENRAKTPVICDENGVVGVYGFCCDERVKIDSETKNVLLLKVRMEDN